MIESNKCLLENEKKYMPGDDFGETTEKVQAHRFLGYNQDVRSVAKG